MSGLRSTPMFYLTLPFFPPNNHIITFLPSYMNIIPAEALTYTRITYNKHSVGLYLLANEDFPSSTIRENMNVTPTNLTPNYNLSSSSNIISLFKRHNGVLFFTPRIWWRKRREGVLPPLVCARGEGEGEGRGVCGGWKHGGRRSTNTDQSPRTTHTHSHTTTTTNNTSFTELLHVIFFHTYYGLLFVCFFWHCYGGIISFVSGTQLYTINIVENECVVLR